MNSVPGVFDMAIQKVDQPQEAAPAAFVAAAGWSAAKKPATNSTAPNQTIHGTPVSVTDLYNGLIDALRNLEIALSSNLPLYADRLKIVRESRDALLGALQPVADDSGAVGAALLAALKAEGSQVGSSATELADRWAKLNAFLGVAPAALGKLSPQVFHYIDRDFDLVVDVKTSNLPFTIPTRRFIVIVQLAKTWTIRTTTGIMVSGLWDEHYTKRTVIVTPAASGTAAVTNTEVVRERRDAGFPEVTMLMHIAPRGANDRNALTLGIGVASGNASGRIYAGYSHKLGQSAAWSIGVAGGNVKRLSKSIDPKNPGSADPEQTRRDVFKFAPFIGISVRLGGT
ncbi:MAG TPA: hypothetical protein VK648_10880 [Gemmatimonadaceae bacterium]|nr:hypothetical protein [Gemmatimonadaceae bacterium]